jgi:hypothetical protein
MGDRPRSFPGCAQVRTKVCRKDYGWSVGLVYDHRGAARSNDHQTQSGWGVTNGIRADPRDFTGAYGSVEKDTVAYGSGTWVRTHDVWVLREGHGMVHMLLTECTVHVCQYWMYGTWSRGDVPGLGLTDEDVGLLWGVDYDILSQGLIGLIKYPYH